MTPDEVAIEAIELINAGIIDINNFLESVSSIPRTNRINVLQYIPIPGEFRERDLIALSDLADFVGLVDGDPDNSMLISISSIYEWADDLETTRGYQGKWLQNKYPFLKVAKQAKRQGYRFILLEINSTYDISEHYRDRLARRGLEGSLSGLRKEAKELREYLLTEWDASDYIETFNNKRIKETPLYRYLILPKATTPGMEPKPALTHIRKMITDGRDIKDIL